MLSIVQVSTPFVRTTNSFHWVSKWKWMSSMRRTLRPMLSRSEPYPEQTTQDWQRNSWHLGLFLEEPSRDSAWPIAFKGSCPRWVIAISFWRRTDFSWRKGNVYWYVQSSPVLYCFGWSCCCRFRVLWLIGLCCFLLLVIIPISRARGVGKGHTSSRREESWDGDESKPTRLRKVRTSWRACWRWLLLLFPLQWRLLAFFAWLACLCLIDLIYSTYSYAFELAGDYWLAGLSLSYHWVGNETMKLCPFPPVSKQVKTLTLRSLL